MFFGGGMIPTELPFPGHCRDSFFRALAQHAGRVAAGQEGGKLRVLRQVRARG